jgi:hypothetical protein
LNTTFPEAGVNDIGIARIDRKALRTTARERKRDLPSASALIEAGDTVAGGRVQSSHAFTLG